MEKKQVQAKQVDVDGFTRVVNRRRVPKTTYVPIAKVEENSGKEKGVAMESLVNPSEGDGKESGPVTVDDTIEKDNNDNAQKQSDKDWIHSIRDGTYQLKTKSTQTNFSCSSTK